MLERIVDVGYKPVERLYSALLGFAMRRRWVIVLLACATLGSCIPLVQVADKGFLPRNDEAQMNVAVRSPEGTSLAATQIAGERIAREIRKLGGVESTLTTVGDDDAKTQNLAHVYVRLVDPALRKESQDQKMDEVRQKITSKQAGNLRITVSEVGAFSGGGFSTAKIQYTLSGPDLKKLETYSDSIVGKLKKVPGAVDVDSSLITGKPEIGVYIDRARAVDVHADLRLAGNERRIHVDRARHFLQFADDAVRVGLQLFQIRTAQGVLDLGGRKPAARERADLRHRDAQIAGLLGGDLLTHLVHLLVLALFA